MKENNDIIKEKLLKRLEYWYDNAQFDKIITKVLEIPENDRDYDTISFLAKTYNSVDKFQSAIIELNSVKNKGENDPLWHFRLGYAYFNIDKYEDALKEYEIAHSLDKENKLIKTHLDTLKVNLFVGKHLLEDEINT